jgi:hypothetical protein
VKPPAYSSLQDVQKKHDLPPGWQLYYVQKEDVDRPGLVGEPYYFHERFGWSEWEISDVLKHQASSIALDFGS